MAEPTDGTAAPGTTITGVAEQGGTVNMDASMGDASLQGEALRALCWAMLGTLAMTAGTIFMPMWLTSMTDGAYDLLAKALAFEEKLLIGLTSSLMTAVTMQRRS